MAFAISLSEAEEETGWSPRPAICVKISTRKLWQIPEWLFTPGFEALSHAVPSVPGESDGTRGGAAPAGASGSRRGVPRAASTQVSKAQA